MTIRWAPLLIFVIAWLAFGYARAAPESAPRASEVAANVVASSAMGTPMPSASSTAPAVGSSIRGQKGSDPEEERSLSLWVAIATIASAVVGVFSAIASAMSAHAARRAADANVMTNRPWVKVNVSLVEGMSWDASGANFPFEFTLENIGHSPALGVWLKCELIVPGEHMNAPAAAVATLVAKGRPRFRTGSAGTALFPREKLVMRCTLNVPNEEFEKEAIRLSCDRLTIEQARQMGLSLALVGCVFYATVPQGEHHTAFGRELHRVEPGSPEWRLMFGRSHGNLPVKNLLLSGPILDVGGTD